MWVRCILKDLEYSVCHPSVQHGELETMLKRSLPCLQAFIQVATEPMSESLSFRHTSWLDYSISTREGQLYSKLHCLLAHIGQYLSGSIELLYSNYLPGNTISNSLLPDIYQRPFWEKTICGLFLQGCSVYQFFHIIWNLLFNSSDIHKSE